MMTVRVGTGQSSMHEGAMHYEIWLPDFNSGAVDAFSMGSKQTQQTNCRHSGSASLITNGSGELAVYFMKLRALARQPKAIILSISTYYR